MNILLVSTSSGSRGGGELSLLYLGRALRERGHEVMLFASLHERMSELIQAFAPIGTVCCGPYKNTYDRRGRSLASFLDLWTARRYAKFWPGTRPDVIHINKQNLEDGLDLLRAAHQTRIPNIAMMHITQSAAYLGAEHAGWRDFVSRRALRKFPDLLVTTPGSRERDLAAFTGSAARIRTVMNGVPIPDLEKLAHSRPITRASLGIRDGEILFVAVGRMMPQKRPLLFLEIADRVLRTLPHARFVWVGDGDLTAEFDAALAAKGLGDKVQRLPWQKEATAFLAGADVFLHVAEFEGLAFAILEALAAGLPCAITPNLLAEMPFLNSTNSIAIDDGDAWLDAVKNPAIGQAARALAEREFSYATMAANYEAIYEEAIALKR